MKILIVRNDRIGDLILSLPAISALRRRYEDAHIAVLVRENTKDILWKNPDVDEVIIDRGQSILCLAKEIREKSFDMALLLYPNWRNALISLFANIPLRIGTGYKPVGILFNKRVYVHRKNLHETDYCLKIAGAVGADTRDRKIRLMVRDEDRAFAESLIRRYVRKEGPIIGICPKNKGSALNWPKEHYAELISQLIKEHKVNVVLTGEKDERREIEDICRIKTERLINLSGETTLGQLIALISLYHIFVGPSTGPMHIAAALRIPVVALFPPIPSQSPEKWGPLGNRHKVLLPKIECRERRCREGCELYNCMERLSPDEVLRVVREFIDEASEGL
jgi:heptosyltransferase-2